MGVVEWVGGFGWAAVGYIVPFLFVLTLVVFFHELGHFLVARWTGVDVKTFSIGFGPELFGFNDRKGTRWKVSAIPLGGYVRFLGDENESSVPDRDALKQMEPGDRARSFAGKGVAARAAIVAAGPIANFVLAIVIFTLIFSIYGREVMTPRVDSVVPNSPAAEAGFRPGDVVVSIDGRKVSSFSDLQKIVNLSAGETLHVVVHRGDQDVTLNVRPKLTETEVFGRKQQMAMLGVSRSSHGAGVVTEHYSVPEAAWAATQETASIAGHTLAYLFSVVVGREPADQIGGPIQVATVSAEVATLGFAALINLSAILSISIGLINLFPIPMLDGGHLLFYAVEAIRGKPLSERVQEIGFRLGFAAVLMLMMFATWNDIIHLSSL
jgi:regulator of sigma E protease